MGYESFSCFFFFATNMGQLFGIWLMHASIAAVNNCPKDSYNFRECIVLFADPKGLFVIRIPLSHLRPAYL